MIRVKSLTSTIKHTSGLYLLAWPKTIKVGRSGDLQSRFYDYYKENFRPRQIYYKHVDVNLVEQERKLIRDVSLYWQKVPGKKEWFQVPISQIEKVKSLYADTCNEEEIREIFGDLIDELDTIFSEPIHID